MCLVRFSLSNLLELNFSMSWPSLWQWPHGAQLLNVKTAGKARAEYRSEQCDRGFGEVLHRLHGSGASGRWGQGAPALAITDTWPCMHGLLNGAGKWLRQQGGIFNFSVLIFSQHPSLCPWTDEKMINTSKCISQAPCLSPITSFQRSANWQTLTPWSKARLPDIYDPIFILIINKQNSIKIHSSFHQIPSVNS